MPATTSTDAPAVREPGATPPAARAIAPDLVRGAMLLGIAVANAAGAAAGGQPGIEPSPSGTERPLDLALLTFVHARVYPVFAVMFGYGLVQLAARQRAGGVSPAGVRAVLVRRNLWLLAFGFCHAALLYFGDFLGAYGIAGVVATLVLLPRGERVHRAVPWLWGVMLCEVIALAVMTGWGLASEGGRGAGRVAVAVVPSLVAADYPASLAARLAEWPWHTATVVPFVAIVWLGMWAARQRLLDEPAHHRRLLRLAAAVGLAVAFGGGLPLGLVSAGWLRASEATVALMTYLHLVSGMFGGPGYAALGGLLAIRLSGRVPSWTRACAGALVALGQRTLTGYLLQSVAWLALLAPFGLAAGRRVESPLAAAVVIATLVWIVSVLGAWWLARRGQRGPAEALLRRLTYGSRRRP